MSANTIVFRTERLIARRINHGDYDTMYSIYGDPFGAKYVDDGSPISPVDCRKWIDITLTNYQNRGYGMFAFENEQLKKVIGFGGIVHPGDQSEPEIKYSIQKDHWNLGYATEIATGLISYGVKTHGIDYFIATVDPDNSASRRVLEKIGMVLTKLIEDKDGGTTCLFSWSRKKPL